MGLRVGAGTSRGRVRDLNEDVYSVRAMDGLFIVCDGMGGAPAGEVASQIAASTILQDLDAAAMCRKRPASRHEEYRPQTNRLAAAVRHSNDVIYEQGRKDPRHAEMGTTVVGAWVMEQVASVAHVGDSRAYLWRDECLQRLTRDHSLAEMLIEEGLSPDVPLSLEQESSLVRVLGGEPDVAVDVKEVPVRPGDYLLLCSDGLTRMVTETAIRDAISRLRDPQRICDDLIDQANRNGGADNVTVVVVEIAGSWWKRLATRWRRDRPGADDAKAYPSV